MPTISERPDQADETAPFPEGWKKTVSELMAERRTITPQELEWARAYERAQLRSWARFPRDAEIYEAIGDMTISYVTYWHAPFTGGNKGRIRRGTRVRVTVYPHDPEPIDVQAQPLERERIERELVPESDRTNAKYVGYGLVLSTRDLNKAFRLIAREGGDAT